MKRILSVILCLALMLSLVGCSGETSTSAAGAGESKGASGQEGENTSITSRLSVLADDGVIGQDTLNSIIAYLEMNNISLDEQTGDKPQGDGNAPDGQKPDDKQQEDAPDGEGSVPADAPEKPADNNDGDNPPEKPDGEKSDGGHAPDGKGNDKGGMDGTLIPTSVLDKLLADSVITQDEYDAIAAYRPAQGGIPGGITAAIDYAAANTISSVADHSDGVYDSSTADENALLIDTAEAVVLKNPTVTKTGDSEGGDSCNFYGVNAGVLAMGGAQVTISGGTVTTDADGANGVFSYGGNGGQNGQAGDGTVVNISDTTITTTGDNAGGIMTTGGGVTNAENLTISTYGRSSAAIRTDRGGGTVTVTGGTYETNGLGSPAVYSTADITVNDAALTSNLSEGVCIEGKNTVTLNNTDLTVSNTERNGNATFLDSVNIYQSMSGDADSGTSCFSMTGGTLTSRSGHVLHVTNTNAVINLSGVTIVNEDADNILLSVCDDGWSGAENIATLNADGQTLSGAILVGDNSSLTLNLANGSTFTGSIGGEIKNASGETVSTEVGEVDVTLGEGCTWTLTADSYVTSFTGDASQIVSNGYTLYVNGTAVK